MARAWEEKCSCCRRRRKVYAYWSLTFYCYKCWHRRDASGATNTVIIAGERPKNSSTGPIWEWDARPGFVFLH